MSDFPTGRKQMRKDQGYLHPVILKLIRKLYNLDENFHTRLDGAPTNAASTSVEGALCAVVTKPRVVTRLKCVRGRSTIADFTERFTTF